MSKRNSPCVCESGKKYKNCCGKPKVVPVSPTPTGSPYVKKARAAEVNALSAKMIAEVLNRSPGIAAFMPWLGSIR